LAQSSERDDIVSWAAATMYGGKTLLPKKKKTSIVIVIEQLQEKLHKQRS
jgi:hypothetical protein